MQPGPYGRPARFLRRIWLAKILVLARLKVLPHALFVLIFDLQKLFLAFIPVSRRFAVRKDTEHLPEALLPARIPAFDQYL